MATAFHRACRQARLIRPLNAITRPASSTSRSIGG